MKTMTNEQNCWLGVYHLSIFIKGSQHSQLNHHAVVEKNMTFHHKQYKHFSQRLMGFHKKAPTCLPIASFFIFLSLPFRHFLFCTACGAPGAPTSHPRPVTMCLGSEPSLREGKPNSGEPQAVTVVQLECTTLPSLPVSGPESRLLFATGSGQCAKGGLLQPPESRARWTEE